MYTAVLIETVSIQNYIFNSNKLTENVGASYIIEHVLYDNVMTDILKETFRNRFSGNWKENPDSIAIKQDNISCEVGYSGGGNTLVLFKNTDDAKHFIKKISTECLIKFPALRIAFGITENFDLSDYKQSFGKLLDDLKTRKSAFAPLTSIQKHGITTDCPYSNDSAEKFDSKNKKWISTGTKAKFERADELQKKIYDFYPVLDDKYTLTCDIEKLGQDTEKSYIAVVHVDGNGMGKVFSNIDSLQGLREKSLAVSSKAADAMINLIKHIINMLIENEELSSLKLKNTDGKIILPIRPILVGGDDITFICEGRLGMYLAEKFIALFFDKTEREKDKDSNEKLMDGACAGVAIVKTHFPFYKAVTLAEELCAEAKKLSRGEGENKCYISYYCSSTTFSGTLSDLRKKTHKTDSGYLYYGPYRLFNDKDKKSISKLKSDMIKFSENDKWSKNKVMALREAIIGNNKQQRLFEKEISELGVKLPDDTKEIWEKDTQQTPYYDQIELMDFYLETLLKKNIDED